MFFRQHTNPQERLYGALVFGIITLLFALPLPFLYSSAQNGELLFVAEETEEENVNDPACDDEMTDAVIDAAPEGEERMHCAGTVDAE